MIPQSGAKIFVAGERGLNETDWFRSYNTFNFGAYQQENKAPFGPLYMLNDDTLAGGKGFKLLVEEDTDIILLPTVGAITYNDSNGHRTLIEAGQVQRHTVLKGATIEMSNPYQTELVNFLHLWIKHSSTNSITQPELFSFDLNNHKNKLIHLFRNGVQQDASPKIFIGKFDGREEAIYKLTNENHGLFVFVIEGAFEVQYRLLEARDGLALWDVAEIEVEALSNDAIILGIEVDLTPAPFPQVERGA